MALKPLKPPALRKPPRFTPYKPQVQKLINRGGLAYKPLANLGYKPPPRPGVAPRSTTAGLTPYTGYEGPGVQDFINQGTIQWDQGLGDIGYTAPTGPGVGQTAAAPDYGSLISGDWEVQDAEAAMASQMARARGDFQAQLRSQLIDLGIGDASKLGSLGKYIDADTIKKAVENKYSASAQNAQQAERGRALSNAALAARGLLSSGQTTKTQQDITAQQEGANYSALRGFLEGGASGLSGLADMEYQMARGVAQARQAAAMRAAELYPMGDELGPEGAAPAAASAAAAGRAGWTPFKFGRQGSYMTRQTFQQQRPGGNYQNYLNFLKRRRGGRL